MIALNFPTTCSAQSPAAIIQRMPQSNRCKVVPTFDDDQCYRGFCNMTDSADADLQVYGGEDNAQQRWAITSVLASAGDSTGVASGALWHADLLQRGLAWVRPHRRAGIPNLPIWLLRP
jgi:hypothetical protein